MSDSGMGCRVLRLDFRREKRRPPSYCVTCPLAEERRGGWTHDFPSVSSNGPEKQGPLLP